MDQQVLEGIRDIMTAHRVLSLAVILDGEPEEVAQITLSLVLPAASYLNGVVIPVDGGLHVKFGG